MPTRKNLYSDLPRNFTINPITGDLNSSTDERAVNSAIMGIIDTPRGSIPFNEDFGCDLPSNLFENMGILSTDSIRTSIRQAIRNFEPRVTIQEVEVLPLYDENAYIVEVRYKMITDRTKIYSLKMALRGDE